MTQSSDSSRPRVLMFVLNELVHDARVLKTAGSLTGSHEVLLAGLLRGRMDVDQDAEQAKWPFALTWVDLGRWARLPRNMVGYALRWLFVFRRLLQLGRTYRPAVVHAHELAGLPIGLAIGRATGARVIYDAHELYRDMTDGAPWYWRFIAAWETRLMQACDAIIACSDERARIMLDEYRAPFLPVVVANMPTARDYEPSRVLWDRTGAAAVGVTRLVLYQGAVMVGRGLDHLPTALASLPDHVGIVVIGGGDDVYRRELQARADALGVAARFFLLPPVPQTELFAYTCSADMGVVIYRNTCRNNYYCAPNKLYEYCAAGLPMAGADLPPIRSFLTGRRLGEVFDPEDAGDLAAVIDRILGDDTAFDAMRARCLETAEVCNWEAQPARVLADIYRNLLGEGVANLNTADYWDGRFATGDWDEDGGRRQTAAHARVLLPHLDLPRDFAGKVLDFGCALGDAIPVYRSQWPDATYIGLDHSAEAVARGRRTFGDIAEFVQGDHLSAPYAEVIIASHVLEHLADDLGVARELLTRCRDLYIVVPYREHPLFHEHLRAYDEARFDALGPLGFTVFAMERVRFDRKQVLDIWLKNLVRPLLGKPIKKIAKSIVYHLRAPDGRAHD